MVARTWPYLLMPAVCGLTVAAWLAAFPINTPFAWDDIVLEGTYLAAVLLGSMLVVRHGLPWLILGIGLFAEALVFDLLDEFTREPDIFSNVIETTLQTGGVVILAGGLFTSHRRLRNELERSRRGERSLRETETLLRLQRQILERIAVGTDTRGVLDDLCRQIETMVEGARASVLLLGAGGSCLRFAAGPSLDPALIEAVDGLVPGEVAGSCGTAVHTGEPVFVSDTSVDPRWEDLRAIARQFNIGACWSLPIFGDDQKPIGSFAVSFGEQRQPQPEDREVLKTASHLAGIALHRDRAVEALRRSEDRYRQLVEGLRIIAFEFDRSSMRFTFVSRPAEQILGYPMCEWNHAGFWADHIHEDDRERVVRHCREQIEAGLHHELEYRMIHADGSTVWFRDLTTVERRDGVVAALRGVLIDITALKTTEERLRLMMRELDHRVRNHLLALEALIDLTRSSSPDTDSFARSIKARVNAMGRVHDLLSSARWSPIALRRMIEVLTPPERRGRLEVEGPEIHIPAAQSTALGMVIHELLVNSLKHGALGAAGGTVHLRWESGREGDGEDARECHFSWRERGGPAVAAPPARGVGTQLIEGLILVDLRGEVDLEYRPDGADHRFAIALGGPGRVTRRHPRPTDQAARAASAP